MDKTKTMKSENNEFFLDCLILKMETLRSFETSEITRPKTRPYMPKELHQLLFSFLDISWLSSSAFSSERIVKTYQTKRCHDPDTTVLILHLSVGNL